MLLHQQHLSAQEIASLELEGLPATREGVRLRAEREGWASIERQARGGGRCYAVASLPAAAQADLRDRQACIPSALRPVGRPKGSGWFAKHQDVAAAVEAYIAERDLAIPRLFELLSTQFRDLPSTRTLARFVEQLEASKPALLASTRDPDAYKSKYRLALGRADAAVSYAHQVWEIDTTKADVLTREGRRSILGIIDVWSRRARYLVVESESAAAVRRTLISTIEAWGVMPERLKTDQGSGYINGTMATALPLLGIEHEPCPPGSPEKKPHVERLFGTFTRERAALLAGFAGHNVAEATKLRAKARKDTGRAVIVPEMTEADLQDVIDGWLDGVYHQRVHSTIGATPLSRWTNSPRPAAASPGADRLRIALSALVGTLVVGKRGIQWKHGRYWAPELAPFIGRPVQVRRDEDEHGELFVFDEDGHFVGTAVNAARSGMTDQAFAEAARRQQSAHMAAARADLRAKQSRFRIEDARDALLRRDAEAAGKLATFPVPTEPRSTRALDSLATPAPRAPDLSPAAQAAADRILAAPKRAEMTVEERIADTDRILAEHANGAVVDPDALRAARIYAGSSEYRGAKIVATSFGRPAQPLPSVPLKESRL